MSACLPRLLVACCLFSVLLVTPAASAQPNVVLIQTDDQTLLQLHARDAAEQQVMPNVLSRIAGEGVTFDRYYVTYPICCPARTSLLTGLYVHSHRVLINRPPYGYTAFRELPVFTSNIATWLQSAGYRTIHVGKFMNFYGDADPAEVPPGWSDWETIVSEEGGRRYYGAAFNDNGQLVGPLGDSDQILVDPPDCRIALPGTPGACNYTTDVDTALAVDAIHKSAGAPFFMQVDYTAPHVDMVGSNGPAVAPRDEGTAAGLRHRPPSYDERDVSDKPRFIRFLHRLNETQRQDVDQRYRRELESLRAVDTGVGAILDALEASGQMANTYVFFTSDNGQFHGEHRIAQGKYLPYEPASHVPLLIRGPGIQPGSHSPALVANIDLAPTVAELAGISVGADGRSIMAFARNPALRSRRPILLEGYAIPGTGAFHRNNTASVLDYFGVVVGRYKYVRYAYGDRELYDLVADPDEQRSLALDPQYRRVLRSAQRLTNHLKHCRFGACRRPAEASDFAVLPKRAEDKQVQGEDLP
jgi:N-acetylglucosamine-6-sulfatase